MESWEKDLQKKEEMEKKSEAAYQEAFEECVIIAMRAIEKIKARLREFDYTTDTIKEIFEEAMEV